MGYNRLSFVPGTKTELINMCGEDLSCYAIDYNKSLLGGHLCTSYPNSHYTQNSTDFNGNAKTGYELCIMNRGETVTFYFLDQYLMFIFFLTTCTISK